MNSKNKITIVIWVFLTFFCATDVSASCTVQKDDGTSFTDVSVNSCTDYFLPQHQCADSAFVDTPVCKRLRSMVAIDWTHPSDQVISPHRGIWGYRQSDNTSTSADAGIHIASDRDGHPQNTRLAAKTATDAGYRFIELDFMLAWDYPQSMDSADVYLTHFGDLAHSVSYSGRVSPVIGGKGFLANTDSEDIGDLYQRSTITRQVYDHDSTKLQTIEEFLDYAESQMPNDTIFLVDPKWSKRYKTHPSFGSGVCVIFCVEPFLSDHGFFQDQYKTVVRKILKAAADRDMLANIIVKVPPKVASWEDLQNIPHRAEVLYSPQVDVSESISNNWYHNISSWYLDKKSVAFVEGVIPDENNWAANPFTFQGQTYPDISDFIKVRFNRRYGIWVVSEQAQWGNASIYFSGTAWLGSFPGDRRGEYIWSAKQVVWSSHSVITTDRPFIYSKLRMLY